MTTLTLPESLAEGLTYADFLSATRAYSPAFQPALKVRKVYGYTRQSLDQYGDGLAIGRQEDMINDLFPRLAAEEAAAGRPTLEFAGFISDPNISATNKRKRRPGWEKLQELTLAGEAHGWIAVHPDRFYRHLSDLEAVINLAERVDLYLATVNTGRFDLKTPEGKVQARMLGSFARYEMERKGDRQRKMHIQRARDGKPWVTTRPFGYEVVKDGNGRVDTLRPHPVEAALLVRAFQIVAAGGSLSSVLREWGPDVLTTGGRKGQTELRAEIGRLERALQDAPDDVETQQALDRLRADVAVGGPWSVASLRRTLLNPLYGGVRTRTSRDPNTGALLSKDWTDGNWPALVSPELVEAVRVELEGRPYAGVRVVPKSMLAGLVRCGLCDAKVRSIVSSRGVREYRCNVCKRLSRNQAALDLYVEQLLVERSEQTGLLAVDERPDAGPLRERLREVQDDLELYQTAQRDPRRRMRADRYLAVTGPLMDEEAELTQQLDDLEQGSASGPLLDPEKAWEDLTLDEKRRAIRALLPVMVIVPNVRRGMPKRGGPVIDPAAFLTSQADVDAWRERYAAGA